MRIILIILISLLLFDCNSDDPLSFIPDPDGSKQREESSLCKKSAVRLFLLSYNAGISQCDDPNSMQRRGNWYLIWRKNNNEILPVINNDYHRLHTISYSNENNLIFDNKEK